MSEKPLHLCIADDDDDDWLLFSDVLHEMKLSTKLTTASNGVALMEMLRGIHDRADLPDVLFLDLNMPITDGLACLKEIKAHEALRHIAVVIYSTSAQGKAVDIAYQNGAALFIKKPDSILKLRRLLEKVLSIKWDGTFSQPKREEFLIEI